MLLLLSILEILMFPWMCLFRAVIVSSRVSAPPPLKYWLHSFLPAPPPQKKSKSLRPPLLYEQPPSKVWRTWPSSPLKSNLVQKSKYSFFKERKDFISNHEVRTIKGEFNFQVFYFCLVVSGKLDRHFQCW